MSADMSSKAWVQSSNDVFAANSSNSTSTMKDFSEVFNDKPVGGAFDEIWKSIQSADQKNKASNWIPPYVHPLEKRSKSSLSEKSLEICTEALGSETGCNNGYSLDDLTFFSSSSSSGKDKEEENEMMKKNKAQVVRKAPVNFPPPLPSLVGNNRGSSNNLIQMRSHRQDGRLVLEAVSVPSNQNCFRAERDGGRLVLTFCPEGGGVEEQNDEEEEKEEEEEEENDEHEECEFDEEQQAAGDDDDVGEEDNNHVENEAEEEEEEEEEEDEDECGREDITDPSAGDDDKVMDQQPEADDAQYSKLEENYGAAGDGMAIEDCEVVHNNNNKNKKKFIGVARNVIPKSNEYKLSNKAVVNNNNKKNLIPECGVGMKMREMRKVKMMMGLGGRGGCGGAAAPAVMVRDEDHLYDQCLVTENSSMGSADDSQVAGDLMQVSSPATVSAADCMRRKKRSLFFWEPHSFATTTSS